MNSGLSSGLTVKAADYLKRLCLDIPRRCVGSEGNRQATRIAADCFRSFGFETGPQWFDCWDWEMVGRSLKVGGDEFDIYSSRFSPGCLLSEPLCVASSVGELEALEGKGRIVLLKDEAAREQLMPKSFVFYNPEHHQKIIHRLETEGFLAVIGATSRNPGLSGAVYPFPLIEDGDFTLPAVYMTEKEGERLAAYEGRTVELNISDRRIPARGCNVVARKGKGSSGKILVCAHIDTRPDTPGALDNAAGVVVLLLLAEMLRDYNGGAEVELLAVNGEEYYSAPGEMLYLQNSQDRLSEIRVAINLDCNGYHEGDTAFSFYGCPGELEGAVRRVLTSHLGIIEGEPWPQGDHGIFIYKGVPAVAITSENLPYLMSETTHTPKDVPGLVDCGKLVETAAALRELVGELDKVL